MAEKKSSSSKKTTTKSTAKKTTQKKSVWGLNKISFYLMGAVAILYLIGLILSACGVNLMVVTVLQNVATALMLCIVAYLGWKYVRPKQTVWLILYFVLLLVIIAGIIVPLIV